MRRGSQHPAPPFRNPGERYEPLVGTGVDSWPSCPQCGGLVSPSRYAEWERQDGNLADLWRAGFAHGVVVGLAIALFAGAAVFALLLAGVL